MKIRSSLWSLVVLYAAVRPLQAFPDSVPMVIIVALHVLPPLLFALIHGAVVYRPRGILVFVLLCFILGNVTENLSILTGFPFGHYHFTDVMGPRLFHVPILLGLAYIGMGYISWTLARLILSDSSWIHPLLAAVIMVAWDLSMEPVWANLVHAWVWHAGGPYFGVPLSNFFGWFLTVYLIYQSFALYLKGKPAVGRPLPPAFRQLPVLFYAVSAAGNFFVTAPPGLPVIADAAGAQWKVGGILTASRLVSVFVMAPFAVLAAYRSRRAAQEATIRSLAAQ